MPAIETFHFAFSVVGGGCVSINAFYIAMTLKRERGRERQN
jgi:hypothetical protein